MTPRSWKRSVVALVLVLAALLGAPAYASAEQELPTLEEEIASARAALAAAALTAMMPRNSLGLAGSIQGDPGTRFGVDANTAIEYRRLITRALSVGVALPADVTTGDRRGVRLILEDPDVSLGLRLFAVRVRRLVVVGGVGAAYGFRLGERNPARVEGSLSFPVPTRPRWAIDVSMGRQFRVGDRPSRYATLGISRAF